MAGNDNESKTVVTQFWAAMQTNDFGAAAGLLSEDYLLEWPQSGESIHGPENFALFNEHYPAAGRWQFTVHRLIAEGDQVVTDVGVTDGHISARAITFSTVRAGRIVRQVEFWPDPFEPQAWRAQWVERA
jgi:ketosteroid isomerase-like protein